MHATGREQIVFATPITRGYTCATRQLVTLRDGRRAFMKTATNQETTDWLHREHAMYKALSPQPFMIELIDFWDDEPYPSILLEDLSHAFWPPPWTMARVEAILEALTQLNSLEAPPFLEQTPRQMSYFRGWEEVAQDPAPFLGLKLCSSRWLERALPTLLEVQAQWRAQPAGPQVLLHQDLRSDNICFRGDQAILIDWNWSRCGEREMDLAFWSASLHMEGGPAPEVLLPNPGAWPAHTSGFWAARAGLPIVPEAPMVRWIQTRQLEYALPWAQRAYELEPLDGESYLQNNNT